MNTFNFEKSAMEALPTGFNFYHLGKVELTGDSEIEIPDTSIGVAFSIYPNEDTTPPEKTFRTLILTVFDSGLVTDIYMEIGNIIASRFANHLGHASLQDVLITPPLVLKAQAVQRLLQVKKQMISKKRYQHIYDGKLIPINVYVMRVEEEEKGHA